MQQDLKIEKEVTKKTKRQRKWNEARDTRVESWRNFNNSKKRRIISKAIELPLEGRDDKIKLEGDEYKKNWR